MTNSLSRPVKYEDKGATPRVAQIGSLQRAMDSKDDIMFDLKTEIEKKEDEIKEINKNKPGKEFMWRDLELDRPPKEDDSYDKEFDDILEQQKPFMAQIDRLEAEIRSLQLQWYQLGVQRTEFDIEKAALEDEEKQSRRIASTLAADKQSESHQGSSSSNQSSTDSESKSDIPREVVYATKKKTARRGDGPTDLSDSDSA